ncbi:MAG: hypothetical protein WBA57_08985 [Elainellaceae cyanobacterium]
MTCPPKKSLKANPFHTYRDPETGQWKVVTVNPDFTGSHNSDDTKVASQKSEKLRHTDG